METNELIIKSKAILLDMAAKGTGLMSLAETIQLKEQRNNALKAAIDANNATLKAIEISDG